MNTAVLPITGDNAQDITEAVLDAVTASADLIDIGDVVGLPVIGHVPLVPGAEGSDCVLRFAESGTSY